MASQDLTEVRCQSGCSYCCHWKVDATEDEVDILIQAIKNGEVKIDMEKLEEQAKHDNDSRLWQSPGENTKCIFLNQSGQCRVYDKRPLSCRKCLVDSDPIHCSEKLQKEVSPILVPEAELITSLTWSLSTGEVEPLPYLLWKKLKQTSSTRSPSP